MNGREWRVGAVGEIKIIGDGFLGEVLL